MSGIGLDIGGANIKVAGEVRVRTVRFALWREPERLAAVLADVLADEPRDEPVLVTMTAESCDCFETRAEGVRFVLDAVDAAAGARQVRVWSTTGGFVSSAVAYARPSAVGSANWHALAMAVAAELPEGRALLVDVGSTTTDLVPLCDARVAARGRDDVTRLAAGELVYVGAAGTPVCALASEVRLRGRRTGVVAECFATMADVMVLVGDAAERPECCDTADGRPLTREHAAKRLLRMVGADLDSHSLGDAVELAEQFCDAAVQRLVKGAARVVAEQGARPEVVVLSGSGEALGGRLAHVCFPGAEVRRLSDEIGEAASSAACAWALRKLWSRRDERVLSAAT